MLRNLNKAPLNLLLAVVLTVSLAGSALMLLIAAVMGSLGVVRAQVLLTFVCLFFGSLLMQVQLRTQRRSGGGGSLLAGLGLVVILVSQVAFLVIVWTNWKASTTVWRVWWLSMVPSVFVTHLILLRDWAGRRDELAAAGTGLCIVWAGLMILYLGLRRDMFSGLAPAFLWIGAIPAAGTVVGSVYLLARRVLRHTSARAMSRRAGLAGLLMSYLVVAVAAFYAGRAGGADRDLPSDPGYFLAHLPEDLRQQLAEDTYRIQARVATVMGDTRLTTRPPFIGPELIEKIQPRLQPGDILLERRNWYLSNPALPGFWPHAALYVGRLGDLERLGVKKHPAFKKHAREYFVAAPDGRGNTVIEAISEGVVLNSLTHSMHADYVAVLRPRVSEKAVARAIIRAFGNLGKKYDFEFDFNDTSKLVCTQVVYESYRDVVDFPLRRVVGRMTLPANDIARKYVTEAGRADRQLDFVLFLDAAPTRGTAFEVDEAAFRAAVHRPRALAEQP